MPRRKPKPERWIKHYSSSHKILLVGEGDFSFSACLARSFGSANKMVATSLQSRETLLTKYCSCEAHLKGLRRLGCLVLHEVDVNDMNRHPTLMSMQFDIIVFNFPHAGHFRLCESDKSLINMHKKLLMDFFESARELLNVGGEVHVSHRDDHPYNRWEIEKLGREAGLDLKEKVEFKKTDYPGYENKRGGDIRCNGTFPLGDSFTFKFTTSVVESSTLQVQGGGGDDQKSETRSADVSEITSNLKHLLFRL